MIVPTTLLLLQYCPCSPHSVVLDLQSQPTYTLWNLEPHIRRCWIMSVFVFLYKYNYKKPPLSNQVMNLIKIVLNTLNAQHHVCHRIPLTVIMSAPSQPTHSRDLSQRSIGGETPPQSPGNLAHTSFRVKKSATSMETHWEEEPIVCGKGGHSNSLEVDDSENMYINAPDRYKSGSTVRGSSQGSFEDTGAHTSEHMFRNGHFKKPVWYLGSEDNQESVKTRSQSPPSAVCVVKSSSKSDSEDGMVIYNVPSEYGADKSSKSRVTHTPPIYITSKNDDNDEQTHGGNESAMGMGSVYGSPESPLSKMDIHSEEKDYSGFRRWTSSTLDLISSKELSLPAPERLLPVGKPSHKTCDELNFAVVPPTLSLQVKEKKTDEKRPKSASDAEPSTSTSRFPTADKPEVPSRSRSISPRHLIKQVALESPSDDVFIKSMLKMEDSHTHHKSRKFANIPTTPHALLDYMQHHGFWSGPLQRGSSIDPGLEQACHASFALKQSSYRVGEDCTSERCSECGMIKEEYNDDEIGLCIIVIGTFVHREPALAAPILDQILSIIAKLSAIPMYSWQVESNINLPGSSGRVAKQFLKVIFQQLIPNGVFIQMFRTPVRECAGVNFFKNVVQALIDFKELCPITPLMMLFEVMNNKKSLPLDRLPIILNNMASYIECIIMENLSVAWGPFLTQAEIFFRRVSLMMSNFDSFTCFFKNIICILRIPGVVLFKSILDPFSKILSYGIENFTLNNRMLLEVCFHCNRAFTRERDKLMLTRIVVFELIQALKAKTILLEANILTLISFVLQDIGGMLPAPNSGESLLMGDTLDICGPVLNTGAAEVMRQHFTDALDFVADFHSLTKIKANYKCNLISLNEDTLGGILKAGISQYIALELTRGTSRDNRVLARYFPWLCNTPAMQQSIRDFVECMGHIRLLSWLLIGTLTNNCMSGSLCQSVPQEVSCYLADHVQVVLTGFPDHAKTSVVHMSSLFHSFVLCQLWTIYLEHVASCHKPNSEPYTLTQSILFDFWGKVTPAILKLISHSKMMSDMVNLHFVSVIEALLECRSSTVNKLLPIWRPILHSESVQLPGHLLMRLQNCQNFPPPTCVTIANANVTSSILLKWLQRLQFRMGQIELQASQATQFYSV